MAQGAAKKIKKRKKSVLKRAAQSIKRAAINRSNRTRVRSMMKSFRVALQSGDAAKAAICSRQRLPRLTAQLPKASWKRTPRIAINPAYRWRATPLERLPAPPNRLRPRGCRSDQRQTNTVIMSTDFVRRISPDAKKAKRNSSRSLPRPLPGIRMTAFFCPPIFFTRVMLPGNAILLNGVLQTANREIGGPRKIRKSQPLGVTVPGKRPGKQQIPRPRSG